MKKKKKNYLFQWDFEFRYKEEKTIGKISATLSLIKCNIYSLFQ